MIGYILLWVLLGIISVSFMNYIEKFDIGEDDGFIVGSFVCAPLTLALLLVYGLGIGYNKAKTFKELTVRDVVFMFLIPTYGLSFLVLNPVYIKTRTFVESDFFGNLMDYKPFEHMNSPQIGYSAEGPNTSVELLDKLAQLEKENEELKQNSRH